jgi:hypothetical protein
MEKYRELHGKIRIIQLKRNLKYVFLILSYKNLDD